MQYIDAVNELQLEIPQNEKNKIATHEVMPSAKGTKTLRIHEENLF